MTSPESDFRPEYNEFYGTDEERIARDRARLETHEARKANQQRLGSSRPLTDDEVREALADIGVEL